MDQDSTAIGLDVHKREITVAVLAADAARPDEVLTIENHAHAIARLAKRISQRGPAVFVYEAGPRGYTVQRQLYHLGCRAVVIAPALTPTRPGDRVKTNRRDAEKSARLYRAGKLTEIRVPTREEEAARDLVRAREDALADRLRARHRLSKFLLRQGRLYRTTRAWSQAHHVWLRQQRFDLALAQQTFDAYLRALDEADARVDSLNRQVLDLAQTPTYAALVQALRCLKGVDTLSAVTLVVETQEFRRFPHARAHMKFTGLVCSEQSSGEKTRRGAITKAGNAHLRCILVEARGATATATPPVPQSPNDVTAVPPRPSRLRAGRKTACAGDFGASHIAGNCGRWPLSRSPASWRGSSGPSLAPRHRRRQRKQRIRNGKNRWACAGSGGEATVRSILEGAMWPTG